MRIGIAADHGGFELKTQLTSALKAAGHDVLDFGAHELVVGTTTQTSLCRWPGRGYG